MEIKQYISKWWTGYWRNQKQIKKKFLETNDNENTIIQTLWDAAKAVLRGKFIAVQSYLKKQEKHWIDNLTLHLKQWDKDEEAEQQQNTNISKRKNHNDQGRNTWKRNERNNNKD